MSWSAVPTPVKLCTGVRGSTSCSVFIVGAGGPGGSRSPADTSHPNPATATAFDRKNVIGLHHFALKVDGNGRLDDLHDKLRAHSDVDVEFAPEPLGGGPTRHMMCAIPGGIRMELIAPAA